MPRRARSDAEWRTLLAERDRQVEATAGILRAISQGPVDQQRVLTAIAESAVTVCDGADVVIFSVEGDRLVLAAHVGPMIPPPRLAIHDRAFAGRAIAASPGDLETVLGGLVQRAALLTNSPNARIFRVDGERLVGIAAYGPLGAWAQEHVPEIRVTPESTQGRAVLTRQPVQVVDP